MKLERKKRLIGWPYWQIMLIFGGKYVQKMKIVVACDSFKGCLSSEAVAEAVACGARSAIPQCDIVCLPVADGGEGTTQALARAMCVHWVGCKAVDPLGRPIEARYAVSADGSTAIMEMAAASGLTLVKPDERNPLIATTYGTGMMINDAVERGCRQVLVGIGGSATNDAGLGMLRALGWKFGLAVGADAERGGGALEYVTSIDDSAVPEAVRNTQLVVACDVTNPFCGPHGAAYEFARQKGANEAMIARLDRGMAHFAKVVAASGRGDVTMLAGAGAAGGLGGALVAFLGAKLRSGIDVVLDAVEFDRVLDGAALVITGEGRLDSQTCMGKAPAGVLARAKACGVPVIAIGGAVVDAQALNRAGFLAALSVQQGALSLAEAMEPATAAAGISATVEQALRIFAYTTDIQMHGQC